MLGPGQEQKEPTGSKMRNKGREGPAKAVTHQEQAEPRKDQRRRLGEQ